MNIVIYCNSCKQKFYIISNLSMISEQHDQYEQKKQQINKEKIPLEEQTLTADDLNNAGPWFREFVRDEKIKEAKQYVSDAIKAYQQSIINALSLEDKKQASDAVNDPFDYDKHIQEEWSKTH